MAMLLKFCTANQKPCWSKAPLTLPMFFKYLVGARKGVGMCHSAPRHHPGDPWSSSIFNYCFPVIQAIAGFPLPPKKNPRICVLENMVECIINFPLKARCLRHHFSPSVNPVHISHQLDYFFNTSKLGYVHFKWGSNNSIFLSSPPPRPLPFYKQCNLQLQLYSRPFFWCAGL